MRAQSVDIDEVLRRIEANNKELQANAQLITSQKLENKSENNLPDPTLSYSHLWGAKDKDETIGELVVSQSFDFPTLYATRGQVNRLKTGALDAQSTAFRQQLLLQAKEICLDILMLQQQQRLLDERLKQAEELSAYYKKRLETGDANVLETNKINLELLNVRTEARTNRTTLENKWQELTALNSNQPLQISSLGEYPLHPLPADYEQLREEVIASDAALWSLNNESAAARKQISVSKQGWLPKLELGYRRNTESGTPFNGVVVGFSFPIFENRNKVKIAKAQSMNIDFQKENATLQAESSLAQLYREAQSLQASMQEYQEAFSSQQDLALLKQALTGGQISVIEFFVEVSVIYQSKQNLLQLENQYQKVMAQIYKSKL
nr:TolC family protein [Bacteroides oleiciplenus]